MCYFKNCAVADSEDFHKKHEQALAAKMIECGYEKYVPSNKLHKCDEENENFLNDMPVGTFIEQPFGSQQAPDFFVKGPCSNRIALEAKSSKENYPQYNSGGIKLNYYYVFCSEKTNQSTIFQGCDIVTPEQDRMIAKYTEECRARDIEFNKKLSEIDSHGRGVQWYTRPMITQKGGKEKTDYFSHTNRECIEKRVLDSFDE